MVLAAGACRAARPAPQSAQPAAAVAAAGGVRHVVVFRFKPGASPEQVREAAARDAYLPHPAHKAFGELLGRLGILDGAFVVDYAPAP
jgi:hypothetical protein